MKFLLPLVCLLINGCASLTGNAFYKYEKRTDQTCVVTIDSGRRMSAGAELEITDCDVKVKTPSLEQGSANTAVIELLLNRLLPQNESK